MFFCNGITYFAISLLVGVATIQLHEIWPPSFEEKAVLCHEFWRLWTLGRELYYTKILSTIFRAYKPVDLIFCFVMPPKFLLICFPMES